MRSTNHSEAMPIQLWLNSKKGPEKKYIFWKKHHLEKGVVRHQPFVDRAEEGKNLQLDLVLGTTVVKNEVYTITKRHCACRRFVACP